MLTIEEVPNGHFLARFHAFKADRQLTHDLGNAWLCDCLADQAIFKAERTGQAFIESYRENTGFRIEVEEATALAVYGPTGQVNDWVVACGEGSGIVGVWSVRITDNSGPRLRIIKRERIQENAVTALAFVDERTLLLRLLSGLRRRALWSAYGARGNCRPRRLS